MKSFTTRLKTWLVLMSFTLLLSPISHAQEYTLETLIERQKLEDLITRYYYNFGGTPESFADFYVDDGEFIVMGQSHKGKEAIAGAYSFPGGEAPQNYSFNSLISNLLITINGDTATAKLVWTENVVAEQMDPVHMPFQGREYSTFVKVNGEWKYQSRELRGGSEPPAGWEE